MSYFPYDVADVLAGVKCVDFYFDNIYIAERHFREVADAIRNDCIDVVGAYDLDEYTVAAYDPAANRIKYDAEADINLADPFTASMFVHEATHAINDMYRRSGITRIDNEASAYIAQWRYLSFFAPIPEYYLNQPPFSNLANSLAMLKCLMGLSDLFDGVGSKNLTHSVQDLRDVLASSSDLHKDWIGLLAADNRGIPIVAKIKKIDAKANAITATANLKDITCMVSPSTLFYDKDGNDILTGLKDKRFAVGTEVKITREGVGMSNEVSEIKLRK